MFDFKKRQYLRSLEQQDHDLEVEYDRGLRDLLEIGQSKVYEKDVEYYTAKISIEHQKLEQFDPFKQPEKVLESQVKIKVIRERINDIEAALAEAARRQLEN